MVSGEWRVVSGECCSRLPVPLIGDVQSEDEAEARDERDHVEGVGVLEEVEAVDVCVELEHRTGHAGDDPKRQRSRETRAGDREEKG